MKNQLEVTKELQRYFYLSYIANINSACIGTKKVLEEQSLKIQSLLSNDNEKLIEQIGQWSLVGKPYLTIDRKGDFSPYKKLFPREHYSVENLRYVVKDMTVETSRYFIGLSGLHLVGYHPITQQYFGKKK